MYGLFDQVLVRFGGPGSNRGFGVTGSVLVSPDQSVSLMPFFATAGAVIRGIFASRPTDVGGFGIVYGHFSDDLQDSQRRARESGSAVGIQRYEMALELTYRFRFLPGTRSSFSRTSSTSSGPVGRARFPMPSWHGFQMGGSTF